MYHIPGIAVVDLCKYTFVCKIGQIVTKVKYRKILIPTYWRPSWGAAHFTFQWNSKWYKQKAMTCLDWYAIKHLIVFTYYLWALNYTTLIIRVNKVCNILHFHFISLYCLVLQEQRKKKETATDIFLPKSKIVFIITLW